MYKTICPLFMYNLFVIVCANNNDCMQQTLLLIMFHSMFIFLQIGIIMDMARHFYQWRGGCTNVIFVFLDERGRKGKRGTPRIVTQCRSQSKLMFFFYSSIYITICKILLAFLEYKVEFRFREKRVFNSNFEFLLVLKNTIFLTY